MILKLLQNTKLVRVGYVLLLAFIYLMAVVPPRDDLPHIDHGDKLLHAAAFAILAIHMGLCRYRWGKNVGTLIFLLSYGFLIELTQLFIPYRSFDMIDLVSDAIGIIVGILLWKMIKGRLVNNHP